MQTKEQFINFLNAHIQSQLRYIWKRGISAEQQARNMLGHYKTSAEMKRHYAQTPVIKNILEMLEKREKNHQELGGWVYEAKSVIERNPDEFSRVCNAEYLELDASSCRDTEKLKQTLQDLKNKGALRNYLLNRKDEGRQYHIVHLDISRVESYLRRCEQDEKQAISSFCKSLLPQLKENPERALARSVQKPHEKIIMGMLKQVHTKSKQKKQNFWELLEEAIKMGVRSWDIAPSRIPYLDMFKPLLSKTFTEIMGPATNQQLRDYAQNLNHAIEPKFGVSLPRADLMGRLKRLLVDARTEVGDPNITLEVSDGNRSLYDQCKVMIKNKIKRGAKDFQEEYANAKNEFKDVLVKYNAIAKQNKNVDIQNLAKAMEKELSRFSKREQEDVFRHMKGDAFDISYNTLVRNHGQVKADKIVKFATAKDHYGLHCYFHGSGDNRHFHFSLRP